MIGYGQTQSCHTMSENYGTIKYQFAETLLSLNVMLKYSLILTLFFALVATFIINKISGEKRYFVSS